MAYEQGYSTILGLTRAEDPALRALGEGGRGRFSVELGSNLWSERESSGPLAVASGEASFASAAAMSRLRPTGSSSSTHALHLPPAAEAEGNNCPRPRKEDSILTLQTSEPAPSVYANNRPCDEHYDSYDH